jgi:glutaredoxin
MYVLELSPVIDLNRLSKLQVRLVSQLHLPIDRLFASPCLAVILAASLLGQGSSTAFTVGQSDRLPDILGRTSATPSPRPSARAIARPTTRPAAARKKPAARASNRPTAARPVKKPAKPTVAIRPPARPVKKPVKPAVVTRSRSVPVPPPSSEPVVRMIGAFESQGSLMALATHLKQSGAKVYTAYWCGYCRKQVSMFGSANVKLPVIECDPGGKNPQSDLCKRKSISGFPTWEIDGQMYSGMRDLIDLADLSGYRGPRD